MITGQDIHQAYLKVSPDNAQSWDEMSPLAQITYELVARELNKQLTDDTVTIQSVRCPNCSEMLESEHAEGHACWLRGES